MEKKQLDKMCVLIQAIGSKTCDNNRRRVDRHDDDIIMTKRADEKKKKKKKKASPQLFSFIQTSIMMVHGIHLDTISVVMSSVVHWIIKI